MKYKFLQNIAGFTNVAESWQIGFQKPASPMADGIFAFHDDLRVFLVGILVFVIYILYTCFSLFTRKENDNYKTYRLIHASTLEIVWTLVPAIVLIIIAIPSFTLLYSIDEIIDPLFTVKVIGHQWYWSYEFVQGPEWRDGFAGQTDYTFDSYRAQEKDKESPLPFYKYLTVDNYLILPISTHIHARVTSADVLHSWCIPSLGVKLDACPGRLNQTSIFIKRAGLFYGQCSELCGVNHGFRPIGIIAVDLFKFASKKADIDSILSIIQGNVNSLFFLIFIWFMNKWLSGQRRRTVNPLSLLYVGSNPTLFK